MKQLIFSFLFLFCKINFIFGQITIVSGVPSPQINFLSNGGTYNITTSFSGADLGTNVYWYNVAGSSAASIPDHFIYRASGIWKIDTYMFGTYTTTYEYTSPSIAMDPPCTGNWKRYGVVGSTSLSSAPTGIFDFLTLSGTTCSPGLAAIGCTTLNCQYIQLPQLSTATLVAIPSPQQGMFSYNSYLNAPSWFDGSIWKTIYNGIGNYSVGGNLTVTGNLSSNTIINSGTINSTGKIIVADDIILKGTKQLVFQDAVPSTLYTNTIGTTTGSDFNFTLDGPTVMNLNYGELSISGGLKANQVSTFNSGIKYSIITTSSSVTLNSNNYVVIFTAASTCSLPAATTANKGQLYKIINHSTGSVTLSPSVISGATATTSSLASGLTIEVISDGIGWRKLI